ncbi:protein of unknown function [Paraburkholderia dioscoreae]|uniref:Uncharacterized protein n=1 Tax=Paraburkholderia dioscoreae TaxID=2604047 RepID=A0A5Q4ZJI9_9BURK|nr:protein of unknown function [Paraburkholderia dioscoreae]
MCRRAERTCLGSFGGGCCLAGNDPAAAVSFPLKLSKFQVISLKRNLNKIVIFQANNRAFVSHQ